MIHFFIQKDKKLSEAFFMDLEDVHEKVIWIDLLNPTLEEEKQVEAFVGVAIPTREEIVEIEPSSTLYHEEHAVYTAATLVTQSDTASPSIDPVSFILTHKNILVTLRYSEPKAFSLYMAKIKNGTVHCQDGRSCFVDLLEIVIGRCADNLEKASFTMDQMAQKIFRPPVPKADTGEEMPIDLKALLQQTGTSGDFISKIRQSLATLSRLINYVEQTAYYKDQLDELTRLNVLYKDTSSLRDYANFLSDKVTFLLEATLGMVNIEQNAIIKIFSVAAVIFLPPTLIASIYGMNFKHMPELDLYGAYPAALALMVLSAYMPYRFFKKKGWL